MTPLAAAILAVRKATGQRSADIARALGCSAYYAEAILRRHDPRYRLERALAAGKQPRKPGRPPSKGEGINPHADELIRHSYRCASDALLAALRRAHPGGEP